MSYFRSNAKSTIHSALILCRKTLVATAFVLLLLPLTLYLLPISQWLFQQASQWIAIPIANVPQSESLAYASAVGTVGALAAAIYAAIQATKIFHDQKRADDERLLLELAKDFWSVAFYQRRQNASELWDYMNTETNQQRKTGGDAPQETIAEKQLQKSQNEASNTTADADATPPQKVQTDADKILAAAAEWTVVGTSPRKKELVKVIVAHKDFKNLHAKNAKTKDKNEGADPSEVDSKAHEYVADELIRSFFEVLNFWALYATVLGRTHRPPLDDLLGSQWHWTNEMQEVFSKSVDECRNKHEQAGTPHFQRKQLIWQVALENYRNERHTENKLKALWRRLFQVERQ